MQSFNALDKGVLAGFESLLRPELEGNSAQDDIPSVRNDSYDFELIEGLTGTATFLLPEIDNTPIDKGSSVDEEGLFGPYAGYSAIGDTPDINGIESVIGGVGSFEGYQGVSGTWPSPEMVDSDYLL